MRSFFIAIAVLALVVLVRPATANERDAIAHIVEVDLQGDDLATGTAIVREGEEHKPAIWMPLYDGDIIFVRDPKSRVLVDYGTGGRVQVDQTRMRVEISEETAHGGEGWGIISALGELLLGEEGEEVPTNLISKGDDGSLTVPIANRTPNNVVRNDMPVWIEWTGGTAPFTVALQGDGAPQPLATPQDRRVSFDLPPDAGQRVVVIINDANKHSIRVPLRLKDQAPALPDDLANAAPPELLPALTAGWLAGQDGGAWRIEAARMLRGAATQDEKTARLSDALFAGWTPE